MTTELSTSVEVAPSELRESLSVMRLCIPASQQQMQLSLSKLGQLTPVQAYRVGTSLEVFDGLKRTHAAQELSWPRIRVEVHALDAPGAKLRLLRCNECAGLCELEEAWLVRSLYRDDKLSQPQIAHLLCRHKSWVFRRLSLAEGLSDEVTANVRLGLISATAAAELARLQRCNQDAAAQVITRRGLTTRQTTHLVESLLAAPQEQWPKVLEQTSVLPPTPKHRARRRTPGEQWVADAWAIKHFAVRLQTRLLERSLESLGEAAVGTVGRELFELRATLCALTTTIDARLIAQGVIDAAT